MSGIAVGTALAVGAGVSAAGAIGGSIIQSNAAGKAAKAQSSAATYAADLQKQAADDSLAYQKEKDALAQKNMAPWLKAGTNQINNLNDQLANGHFKTFDEKFTAPTEADMHNDPGFQSRLNLGREALDKQAAARGRVLGGGATREAERYNQDYATNEYDKVYGRALGEYQQRANILNTNNANEFNREAAVAGVGQTAAQNLGTLGQQSATNVNNILSTSAAQQGADYRAAGDARASGYINSANAWGGTIGGVGNSISQYMMLRAMMGGGGGGQAGAIQNYGMYGQG
jgi:hypothetical protein